jgi:hypothetical protein
MTGENANLSRLSYILQLIWLRRCKTTQHCLKNMIKREILNMDTHVSVILIKLHERKLYYEDRNWIPWTQSKVLRPAFASTVINLSTEHLSVS